MRLICDGKHNTPIANMGKSSRSSAIKKNNQVLKRKVFGPVETARIERQNAKLLELAKAPKELVMEDKPERKQILLLLVPPPLQTNHVKV